ncbi:MULTISPECIES: hypothetical protein [unclassified Pseudomonas]|uniref:hypothetical protein n=1 Tax=unclassified Pseudomonas TaxID=196821 RepID=UPI00111C2E39|nr:MULTISPECIES: hypothetical protein [unclassified Pseudomonas]
MGYNSTDTAALNAARKAGFDIGSFQQVGDSYVINKIICPLRPACTDAGAVLAGAIEASHRWMEKMTVWLTFDFAGPIPGYVTEAIKSLSAFGTAIVITHDGKSTHSPGPLLDKSLRQVVASANATSVLWHPVAAQLVFGVRDLELDS